jgi:hypothetical protein
VAFSKAISHTLLQELGKLFKKPIWISSLPANIQSVNLKQSRYDNLYIMEFHFTEQWFLLTLHPYRNTDFKALTLHFFVFCAMKENNLTWNHFHEGCNQSHFSLRRRLIIFLTHLQTRPSLDNSIVRRLKHKFEQTNSENPKILIL